MKKRTKRFAALAAIGMMGSMAYGLGVKFTWGGNCDCFCWTNDECWSWVGDPQSNFPNHLGDDVLISAPSRSIIIDTNGEVLVGKIQLHTSVAFYKTAGAGGIITGESIEITSASADIEITADDVGLGA